MRQQPRPADQATVELSDLPDNLVKVGGVHVNTTEEVLIITVDKVHLCLSKHLKRLDRRQGWKAPLSLLVSILLTNSTATFDKTLFGIQAATWEAIFCIGGVTAVVWLLHALFGLCKPITEQDIISDMKQSQIVEKSSS